MMKQNPFKGLHFISHMFSHEAAHLWFLKLDITEDNKEAVIEWLEDRQKFHTWLTSIVTGSIVFFAATHEATATTQVTELQMLTWGSLMFLFFSIVTNMICIWSIPTWKFRIKTGLSCVLS